MGQRQSKLAPRTLAELRNQTNFSVEELQEWYKEFKASWPKGFLTEDEFKGVYSNIFPLGDATEFARHVFRVFDQNKDGLLDFREFMCGFSVVLLGSLEEKLKFSFNIIYTILTEMDLFHGTKCLRFSLYVVSVIRVERKILFIVLF